MEYNGIAGRAIYYERVSTTHEEQDESLENQRALVKSYLKRHPEIELAEPLETFSERVSGKSDERPKYQELLRRLEKKDIRYILVKDLKRLNRSMEVSAKLSSHAKRYDYKIILLSTGQVYDPNASQNRMLYGFESLISQEAVYIQSEYGRIAHRQKCEAKRLNRNNLTYGYAWDDEKKEIVIDEEQANIVREMFDLYVFQEYGVAELRKYLALKGILWSANTVTNRLTETAYIGRFRMNKKGSELGVGAGQKTKRFKRPPEEHVIVERPDLIIVNPDIFILAQKIRESRRRYYEPDKNGTLQARFKGNHLFSGCLFCTCGYPMVHGYADRKQQIGIYRDSFKMRSRDPLQSCSNKNFKRVYEEDLKSITTEVISSIVNKHRDCFPLLLKTLGTVIREDNASQQEISDKRKKMAQLRKQANKVMEKFTYASGALLAELDRKYNELIQEIEQLEEDISRLENVTVEENAIEERLKAIEAEISGWQTVDKDSLDRTTVESFISKMTIDGNGKLDIILKTNEIISFDMQAKKKEDRSGLPSSIVDECNFGTYSKQLQVLIQQLHKERKYSANIELLSFVYESTSYKENKVMHVGIMVEIHS
ncbi:MAG: recombinase family protein [Lachnospiraceae bacterium]|nr:recombinase family protein [Lachnospiraceae bacterium]